VNFRSDSANARIPLTGEGLFRRGGITDKEPSKEKRGGRDGQYSADSGPYVAPSSPPGRDLKNSAKHETGAKRRKTHCVKLFDQWQFITGEVILKESLGGNGVGQNKRQEGRTSYLAQGPSGATSSPARSTQFAFSLGSWEYQLPRGFATGKAVLPHFR